MKLRKNITVGSELFELATELMKMRRFDDFSGFIEQLIREEWERRCGIMAPAQQSPSAVDKAQPAAVAAAEVVVPQARKRAKRS